MKQQAKPEILLPGTEDITAKTETGMQRFVEVKVKTARVIDPVTRGGGPATFTKLPDDVNDDDIIELEFENNGKTWKQWMRVDQAQELSQTVKTRDGAAQSVIPLTWEPRDPSRTLGTIALKALKILGIDTPQKLADKGAQMAAVAVARKFESIAEEQGHTFGLYPSTDPLKIESGNIILDSKKLTSDQPYLIFIHGTASSSIGSFGKLAGTAEWTELQKKYGDRILALEHRTFSVSPIQNALDLANLLPDGARVHLVSHSRGGLVGELICLAQAGGSRAKFDSVTKVFTSQKNDDESLKAAREQQRKDLAKLWDLLLQKQIKVERFVRVACPAYGTTLASKRMDALASGLLNAVGFIPGIKGNPALEVGYDWLKSLLLTLVKEKANPRDLPGIEAMGPDSPLIQFLNHSDMFTESDLGVISGDIEVGNLKLTIPALIGNAFFWAKNDLVVNTKAMYYGIQRQQKAYYFFDQGSTVCHFNYFINRETRMKLNAWLLRDDSKLAEKFLEVQREAFRALAGRPVTEVANWLEEEEAPIVSGPVYSLKVAVSHGDLRYAYHPVAVGHYQGDSIVSAESVLDQALKGRLSQRFQAGLYPGPEGTSAVIYSTDCNPPGALVIGLGQVGELTQEELQDGVAQAALHYALAVLESPEKQKSRQTWRSAAFSSLLLGTYGGTPMGVEHSVAAIVNGALMANRKLQAQGLWDRVRIDEIELIELYEDVAIQAIHAVYNLAEYPPLSLSPNEKVELAQLGLISKEGGRFQRPANQYVSGWWRRIQITGDHKSQSNAATRGLHFLALTDRARAEDFSQGTQRRLVDQFITDAVQTNSSLESEKLGLTLFELLVPNLLKDQAGAEGDLLLVLDKEAAQYPWELLAERTRTKEARPLARNKGMIRQFKTSDFRPSPRSASERNVLVVGDTVNNISPLPGARLEAEEVAKAFMDSEDYGSGRVTQLIGAKADEILINLFARDYNIIHLAGHGLYDAENPEQSGMVLSDGLCLSTAEIKQLRVIPDLVFINCCHLGRIDQDDKDIISSLTATLASILLKEEVTALNSSAFALAEKLIHAGLKAANDQDRLQADIVRELTEAGLHQPLDPYILAQRLTLELVKLQVAQNAHNVYAASISEELIKMGVKAVVAAGWAVDDSAALAFARTFYQQMLGGEKFGAAVLTARKQTYFERPGVNTWGAYQCYGNPDFQLNPKKAAGSWKGKIIPQLSQREYLDKLRSIAAEAKNATAEKCDWLKMELQEMRQRIQPVWLDGRMLGAFANAWAELGDFEQALEHYQLASEAETASVSLRDLEQMANLQSRYARQLLSAKKTPANEHKARLLFEASTQRIEQLLNFGETSERLSLLAGNHKRMAQISSGAQQLKELRAASEAYRRAHELAVKITGEVDYYPALNWSACRWLAEPRPDGKARKSKKAGQKNVGLDEDVIKVIEAAMKAASKRGRTATNFWDRSAEADAALLRHLVAGNLTKSRNREDVATAYKRALSTGGTKREAGSVLDQINFLIEIFESNSPTAQRKQDIEALKGIQESIQNVAK